MRYGASLSHPYLPDIWAAEKAQLEADAKAAAEAKKAAVRKPLPSALKEIPKKEEEKKNEQPSK